jgi:uncharacterized membrane-anchored protein
MDHNVHSAHSIVLNKVPQIAFAFWVIKICATTLGETGGDALSMTLHLGYAISTAVFFALFVVTVTGQVSARSYHPFLYWAVIIATTTVGDLLTKPHADGGLNRSRITSSLIIAAMVIGAIVFTSQKAGSHPGGREKIS